LDIHLDDELIDECTARELVNRIQNMRKEAGFDVSDRISVGVQGDVKLESATSAHLQYVAGETLAEDVVVGEIPDDCGVRQESTVNGFKGTLALRKISG
jgi:isoleucyl-tRNA synthetase